MSIRIVFKGFAQELSPPERLALLARAFNGDRAKAEEALITPNYTLRTLASQAEVGLILPRLEKMGLRCEVVEGAERASGTYQAHEVTARMATCQFCGYEQPVAKVCRKCGASFAAVKKINWKPAVQLESRDEDIEVEEPSYWERLQDTWLFSKQTVLTVVAVLAVLVGFGFLKVPGLEPDVDTRQLKKLGIDKQFAEIAGVESADLTEEQIQELMENNPVLSNMVSEAQNQQGSSSNPIAMIIKGIVTSDPEKVKQTASYDPESGENPYAKRLESLGIDQKEFSKATGVEGPIEGADVQGIIDSNPMLKTAIEDAIEKSGSSQGNTETDQQIEAIQ